MPADPPVYTRETMSDQITAWFDAVDAYRACDSRRVADLLSPADLPDAVAFAMLAANVTVGALVVGAQLAFTNGHAPGALADDERWVVESLDPRQEPSAVERLCAAAVATAANGDVQGVVDKVRAFADGCGERSIARLCEASMMLLSMLEPLVSDERDGRGARGTS